MSRYVSVLSMLVISLGAFGAQDTPKNAAKPSPREALQPLHDLIGEWRCTCEPAVVKNKTQDFWIEKMDWQWQFKGPEAWMKVDFDKGKFFLGGELRPTATKDQYIITLKTVAKETLTFTGQLNDRTLTFEREDATTKKVERIVITLLHANRFLYRYETRPAEKTLFARIYKGGATKEGVPFAAGDGRPECVVSGGLGTTPVMYMGQTYYVCCSGCRAEFAIDPAKYVREFNEKKKKK